MVYKKTITDIFNLIIKEYELNTKCPHEYETFTYTTMSGKEVSIEVEELHQRPAFQKAVQNVVDDYIQKGLSNKIWRVDVPDLDWIKGAKMYRTKNGSTIAIRPDGDIVAVSGKVGDDGYALDNSEALMAYAVSQGGTKLDSFDGNWAFYRKCGFEPLQWIQFNTDKDIRPPLWDASRDHKEPVIFMSYTGSKKKLDANGVINEMSQFYTTVRETDMSNATPEDYSPWDVAYRVRDEFM